MKPVEKFALILFIFAILIAVLFFNTKAVKAQYDIFKHIDKHRMSITKHRQGITISGVNGPLVTIMDNGEVIFDDDYDPDVTAKAFWQSLGERRNCK